MSNEYVIQDYKKLIANIINRLQKENCIAVKQVNGINNQIIFKIVINPVEWYLELDDDTKYDVENNLKIITKPYIEKVIKECNLENYSKIIY